MSILSAVLFLNKHTFFEVYVLPHTTLIACFPLQLGSLAGTWKTKPVCILMSKGMRVNMNKTKVMISGERQMVWQKATRWPCEVLVKVLVAILYSVLDARNGYIRNVVV